jgi:excisionase family DNA binding protein
MFVNNMLTREDFYTISEAAEALGVAQESVRRALRAGKLDSVKPFQQRLITKASVERLLTPEAAL